MADNFWNHGPTAGSCVTLCCPRSSALVVLSSSAWERLGGFGQLMARGLCSGFGCEMGRSSPDPERSPQQLRLLCPRARCSDCWRSAAHRARRHGLAPPGWQEPQGDRNPPLLKLIPSQPLACFCQWLFINPWDNITKTQVNSPVWSSGFPPLFHATCAHSGEHRFRPVVAACARWKDKPSDVSSHLCFKVCTSEWGPSVFETLAFAPESARASLLLTPASILLSSVCQQDPNL